MGRLEIFTDPIGFLEGLEDSDVNFGKVLTLLLLFSIIFGFLQALDFYLPVMKSSESFINLEEKLSSAGFSAGGFERYDLAGYIRKTTIILGLASMVGKPLVTVIFCGLVCLALGVMKLHMGFRKLFRASVYLMFLPLVICLYSTGLNVLSYLIVGNVSILNTAFIPASGWILYYLILGEYLKKTHTLSGRRAWFILAPLSLLIAVTVIRALLSVGWYFIVGWVGDYVLRGVML